MGVLKGVLALAMLCFFLKSTAYGEHSEVEWHLLKSEATIEHCQRVFNEGKMVGMQSKDNGGYTAAFYFGGNMYQVKFELGLQSAGCKAYRISHANRQSQRR